jgi:hypothetical protein
MGTKLVKVAEDGIITVIGDVGGSGQVTMDYSFDYLVIASSGKMFLYDGTTLAENVDEDLGTVVDVLWIDGYFMTTDGEFLIVTELTDPFAVNPLKYGSSEVDPDPIKAIIKLRDEVYALNRYTVEAFDNVGGEFFPFQRIDGAQITRGVIGTHACSVFMENIAFIGGGRNESPSVWLGANGQSAKLSTREIDQVLAEYPESVLADVVCEVRVDKGHQHLHIRLPDQTLVYDGGASQELGEPVWFTLTTSLVGKGQYRAQNFTWCYNKWLVGDPQGSSIGYLVEDVSSHWGEVIGWDFGTLIVYNDGNGALFHELELVALTGRVAFGANPTIWTQYSLDGETWSQERPIRTGTQGNRLKRLVWLQQGSMRHWRIQRFRGTSDCQLSVARLEAQIEPLMV